MSWTYSQSTGLLSGGTLEFSCYSGAGIGKNNPKLQDIPQVGPIPQGEYTMGTPVDSPEHGPFAIPLIPSPTNIMFKRNGFMLHGEALDPLLRGCASKGCIILSPRSSREQVYATQQTIQVVA